MQIKCTNAFVLLGLLTLVPFSRSMAQESGLSFLTIGTDAAAAGRADASTASSRGAFATFWNPANLSISGTNEFALSHHLWIDGIKTYALAARFQTGNSSGLGLFITGTDSGDLEARDQPGPASGKFDAQYLTMGGSFALKVGPIGAGITGKYITERIYNDVAKGYGFDFGINTALLDESVHLAGVLQNVGTMNELRSTATKLPRTVRVGTQFYPFRIVNGMDGTSLVHVSVSVDVSRNLVDDNTRFHVGGDGRVLDILTLRAGFMSNDTLRGFTTGLGLEIASLTFDYALVPFKEGFDGPAHILSLLYAY